MTEATPQTNGNRRGKGKEAESFEQAFGAAREALAEAWTRFTGAIEDTDGELGASISVTLSYKPPSGDKPAVLQVAGKASLPTQRHVFRADLESGQMVLGFGAA